MQFTPSPQSNPNKKSKRSRLWALMLVLLSVMTTSYASIAYAGMFSFLTPFIIGEEVSAQSNHTTNFKGNSQTIALLYPASHFDPNPSKPGNISPINDNVLVPEIAAVNDSKDEVNTEISTYVVRPGDTVSGIAEMFGVSVNTVVWANNISSKSYLQVGQTLVILPISGANHIVKNGDTISTLAEKYHADPRDIISYNELNSAGTLIVGQKIIIPNAEIEVSVPTKIVVKTNPAHDLNGPNYSGYYIRPIVGGVKTQDLHGYNAVDLAANTGTPIMASAAGTVIVSRSDGNWNGGYGNFIIISHSNGTQTLYSHNSKNLVSPGDYVEQGEKIALIGATGKATGPHVHFEIRGAKNPF